MDQEFELDEVDHLLTTKEMPSGITREKIRQYMSAGILFPDEIRMAERIIRRLNDIYRS